MARPKGLPKTGGRRKGTPNKHTKTTLEQYAAVFDGLGGVPAMLAWAEENRTEFYRIHARTLPLDLTSKGNELKALTLSWTFGGREVKF